jgi:predicted peptidase
MGSDAAVSDIVSAVEWMKKKVKVDSDRIYIIGGSGGGYMALLMAGRHPEIWAGVSAWCPISDLKKWCTFHKGKGYGAQIIRNLKGDPRTDAAAAKEAAKRSPVTWLARAKNVAVDIATGIHDGHKGSVPISEAFNAYNCVADSKEKVSEKDIEFMVKNEKVPAGTPEFKDPGYGRRKVHYRKISKNVRVTIFEGGHHILSPYGFAWLMQQRKGRPASWQSAKGSGKSEKLTR